MLDLAFIRNHPEVVKEAARLKNNPIDIDGLLDLDRQVLAVQRSGRGTRKTEPALETHPAGGKGEGTARNTLVAEASNYRTW